MLCLQQEIRREKSGYGSGRKVYDVEEIKVDGLEPTPEMRELLEKEERGEITKEEIRDIFYRRGYTMKV